MLEPLHQPGELCVPQCKELPELCPSNTRHHHGKRTGDGTLAFVVPRPGETHDGNTKDTDYRGRPLGTTAKVGDTVTSRWSGRGVRWAVEAIIDGGRPASPKLLQLRSLSSNRTDVRSVTEVVIVDRAAEGTAPGISIVQDARDALARWREQATAEPWVTDLSEEERNAIRPGEPVVAFGGYREGDARTRRCGCTASTSKTRCRPNAGRALSTSSSSADATWSAGACSPATTARLCLATLTCSLSSRTGQLARRRGSGQAVAPPAAGVVDAHSSRSFRTRGESPSLAARAAGAESAGRAEAAGYSSRADCEKRTQ